MKWTLASAGLVAVVWLPSTFFFVLEAWGGRGEPKSWVFELWAAFTWFGPLAVLALLIVGLLRYLRRP